MSRAVHYEDRQLEPTAVGESSTSPLTSRVQTAARVFEREQGKTVLGQARACDEGPGRFGKWYGGGVESSCECVRVQETDLAPGFGARKRGFESLKWS